MRLQREARKAYQTRQSIRDPGNPTVRSVTVCENRRQGEGSDAVAGGEARVAPVQYRAARLEPGVRKVALGRDLARPQAAVNILHNQGEQFGIRSGLAREQSAVLSVPTVAD